MLLNQMTDIDENTQHSQKILNIQFLHKKKKKKTQHSLSQYIKKVQKVRLYLVTVFIFYF